MLISLKRYKSADFSGDFKDFSMIALLYSTQSLYFP